MKERHVVYKMAIEVSDGISYPGRVGMLMRALIAAFICALTAAPGGARDLWVTAYYPGWRQRHLEPANIDFSAITHLVHFGVVPRPDGSLDAATNLLTPGNIRAAVDAAHGAGKKILFTVGGQATRERFAGAMSAAHRESFISALVAFMRGNGYDGIDVDMEALTPRDAREYSLFIRELRARLNAITPRPLLTAAVLWEPAIIAQLAAEFDQINLMTYNLAGPYPGWVVWHNGPLYDGGRKFPGGRASLPSADGLAEAFLAAGVPRSKLGVGLSFNGYVWSGGEVSRPGQSWRTTPAMKSVPYYALAETYRLEEGDGAFAGSRWDAEAQAAYISVEGAGPADAQFISYSSVRSAARAVKYARSRGLGGLIIWDIAAGYRVEQPPGRRDLLLQAVKQARRGAGEVPK